MRRIALIFAFICCCSLVGAQEMSDGYLREFGQEDGFLSPRSETDLLRTLPGDGTTLFGQLARYNFNFVSYRNRGYDGRLQRRLMEGMDVSFTSSGYPDYTLLGALRIAAPYLSEGVPAGLYASAPAGVIDHGLRASQAREGISARLYYSEQRYRGGARVSVAQGLGAGWHAMFNGQYRAGEDKFIDGVFSEAAVISAGVEKNMQGAGSLSLMGLWSSSQRGMRTWTVREAHELTGNNYYNPSWGWYGDRRRNSRVRNDEDLLIAGNYAVNIPANTRLSVSALYRSSQRAVSGLAWWDAQNPSPDYYTRLPGYNEDSDDPDRESNPWFTGDEQYTQLNWEDMLYANTFARPGRAAYIIEDRVERGGSFRAAATASYRKANVEADYGARFTHETSNFFRRAKDMLGGEYVMDYDQYLIDDTAYGEKYHNNLRDPERRVYEGDRYGYDYDIIHTEVTLFGSGRIREGRWLLDFGAEISFPGLRREGYNEKENFPGSVSFGRSERLEFTEYYAGFRAAFLPSQMHQLAASAFVQEQAPGHRDLFLAPDNHNTTVSEPDTELMAGGEITYRGVISPAVTVDISAYYTHSSGATEIYRYWDDIFAEYVLMPLGDISRNYAGVELGVKADITSRLRVQGGVALNSYKYAGAARAAIYADDDMSELLTGAQADLSGYVCSPSPQRLATASMRYTIPYSWGFEATVAYVGGRYVSLNPARRMNRIGALASSPEARAAFEEQERLPDAAVVNLRVTKSFRVAGCSLFASLSVNNLLGRTDILYGGYEQMRIRKRGSGINRTYSPFPSRYGYSYPRSVQAILIINL